MNYKVNEIFYSLQGEGRWAGTAATFIRLAGCNLNCEWCDTDHTEKFVATEQHLLSHCSKNASDHVVITGGEPCLQDLMPFLLLADEHGLLVHLETNGTIDLRRFGWWLYWITVSPKSVEVQDNWPVDELKIIWPCSFWEDIWVPGRDEFHKYVQPCDDENYDDNLKSAIEFVKENPEWKLSIQTQKILGIR
jgi:organic radical activating enzyme